MERRILLSVVVLLVLAGVVCAQESALHGSIDVAYTTKYIWRGFDVYDDHSAIHPSIDLDLYGSGFGFNVAMHRANSSGFENTERWDYTLYYRGSVCESEAYATNYMIGYRYYNYPDMPSGGHGSIDLQEIHTIFSWPNILPVKGLVPTYCLVKLWPSESGTIVGARSPSGGTSSGLAHIFMLDYGLSVPCPLTGESRTLNLHSEFIYNDGVSPLGTNVDHDWSNAVFGVSTDIDLGNNLTFTPGFYFQSSWDDSVNPEDEYWASFNIAYKF
jgi:hypothetical protein